MDNQTNILNTILKSTYTKKQVIRRFRLIKDFLNMLFFDLPPDTSFKDALAKFEQSLLYKSTGSELIEFKFLEALGGDFYKLFKPENFHIELETLEKDVLNVKDVILYLPFEIPDLEVEKLGIWFKQNLGNNVLFEINYDPSLIGGVAVSLGGVYKDYSLKQKIQDNKAEIIKLLTGFK